MKIKFHFHSIIKKHFNEREAIFSTGYEYMPLMSLIHTHTLPEIQVCKELIIYKTVSFLMYTPIPARCKSNYKTIKPNISRS